MDNLTAIQISLSAFLVYADLLKKSIPFRNFVYENFANNIVQKAISTRIAEGWNSPDPARWEQWRWIPMHGSSTVEDPRGRAEAAESALRRKII